MAGFERNGNPFIRLISNNVGFGISSVLLAAGAISILMLGLFNTMEMAGRGKNTSEVAIVANMHLGAIAKHFESDFICGCFFDTTQYAANQNTFDPTPATLSTQTLTMDQFAVPNPDCSPNRILADVDVVAGTTRFNQQNDLTLTSMTVTNFVAVRPYEAYGANVVLQITNTAPANQRGWGGSFITRTIPITVTVRSPNATTAVVTGCNHSTAYLSSSKYYVRRATPTAILITDIRNPFSSNRQNAIRFRLSDGTMVANDATVANAQQVGWIQGGPVGREDASYPGASSWAYLYAVNDQDNPGQPVIVGSGRPPVSGAVVAQSGGPTDDGHAATPILYPPYKFLTAIRKDAANNIVDFRHEGDSFYWRPTGIAPVYDQTVDLSAAPYNLPVGNPAGVDAIIGGSGNKNWVLISASHAIVSLDLQGSGQDEYGGGNPPYGGYLHESGIIPDNDDYLAMVFFPRDVGNLFSITTGPTRIPVRQIGANITVRARTVKEAAIPALAARELLRIHGWVDQFVNKGE